MVTIFLPSVSLSQPPSLVRVLILLMEEGPLMYVRSRLSTPSKMQVDIRLDTDDSHSITFISEKCLLADSTHKSFRNHYKSKFIYKAWFNHLI